jgi:hypothetical protein
MKPLPLCLALSLLGLIFDPLSLFAQPAQVILIRHAEKPKHDKDDPNLSKKGRERAALLVGYFEKTPELIRFGTPFAIYAQQPHKRKDGKPKPTSSLRPIQTVTPLAKALKKDILGTTRDEFQPMVDAIMKDKRYHGKMVLVCWEHNVLPKVAKAFVKGQTVKDAPKWEWPGDHVYDLTWVITFHADKKATFHQYRQPFKLKSSDE